MKRLTLLFQVIITAITFAQVPDPPFNPMTAPGASGISTLIHTLYWQNPEGVNFNEVYFSDDSALVANNDTSVRVINGYPSTVFSSLDINGFGPFNISTKYYWKVLEYNSSGPSISPLWDFTSFAILLTDYNCSFNSGFEGWQIFGPLGFDNWVWWNSSHTGSTPGEIAFKWTPIFVGDSYIMSPEIIATPGSYIEFFFKYYEDWWSNIITVGCAITTNDGITWNSIWELQANGDVGPAEVDTVVEVSGNFRLGFYYTGDANDIDFLYVDSVKAMGVMPLTPPYPPAMLTVNASDTQQKVTLNWTSGGAPGGGLWGYQIQRKFGLPDSDSAYVTIAMIDSLVQGYDDYDVELNQTYTYRVRSLVMGFNSVYGNESTVYVPAVVPVELLSFSSSVVDNDVTLNWTTATETNNSGFKVERRETKNERSEEWNTITFVNGNGTTTEPQSYSYIDENLSAGKYQYRLKHRDFDGTFEYSNNIEAEILPPAKISLEQNYPNPFNPFTNIQYSLASRQFVSLKIFNSLGEEIATLVNEEKPAGNHTIEFKPESSIKNLPAGSQGLVSGVYLYQLKAGDFVQTRKMILLK